MDNNKTKRDSKLDDRHEKVWAPESLDERDPLQGTDPESGAEYSLDDEAAAVGITPQDPEHPDELNLERDLAQSQD